MAVPGLLLGSLWEYLQHPLERGLWGSMLGLGPTIPAGVFDSAPIERFLTRMFTSGGRTNDFRKLPHRLYVVATELDSGESVEFGAKRHDDVPIAKAVQASMALPGLFPPTRIGGRDYVDGALKKTLHASVALREGASLVLCINPLVPFDASLARKHGKPKHAKLIEGGLPVVLAQTFRALIHSRMQVGMAQYEKAYGGRRRPAVRAQLGRCRDVLHQRIQLRQPAPRVRPRLPAHRSGRSRGAGASSLRSWRGMASVCAPRSSIRPSPTSRPARRCG